MKVNKIKTHELEKCYAISPLTYNGAEHILIAPPGSFLTSF